MEAAVLHGAAMEAAVLHGAATEAAETIGVGMAAVVASAAALVVSFISTTKATAMIADIAKNPVTTSVTDQACCILN
jgi:hypothetical protein